VLLVDRQLADSVAAAHALIGSGVVRVNGIIKENPASQFEETISVSLLKQKQFVSRGGEKLDPVLDKFGLDPNGKICLDIGSSTGGFTDCLLQRGASRVYAVDVGYGILDWKLRKDARVVVLERTNARFLNQDHVPEMVSLCVIDASFISLTALLEPLIPFFDSQVVILALIKPQFQLPPEKITSGGVITDKTLHNEAVEMVEQHAQTLGLSSQGVVPAPVRGAKGNQEFFILLTGEPKKETH